MKILILYFSGTGNTHFIAEKINTTLQNKDFSVDICSVEDFSPNSINDYNLLVLGYPVYGCDSPAFFQKYIAELKPATHKGLIIFSTMGVYGGNSIRKTSSILSENKFTLLHYEELKMPGSDGLAFLEKTSKMAKKAISTDFNKSENINKAIINISNKISNVSLKGIEANKINLPRKKIGGLIADGLMHLFFEKIERKLKNKYYADDNCISCKTCIKICPSENIIFKDNKIQFLDKCYLCMRCVHQCPKETIQIGEKTKGKFRWKGPNNSYNPSKINQ